MLAITEICVIMMRTEQHAKNGFKDEIKPVVSIKAIAKNYKLMRRKTGSSAVRKEMRTWIQKIYDDLKNIYKRH